MAGGGSTRCRTTSGARATPAATCSTWAAAASSSITAASPPPNALRRSATTPQRQLALARYEPTKLRTAISGSRQRDLPAARGRGRCRRWLRLGHFLRLQEQERRCGGALRED